MVENYGSSRGGLKDRRRLVIAGQAMSDGRLLLFIISVSVL